VARPSEEWRPFALKLAGRWEEDDLRRTAQIFASLYEPATKVELMAALRSAYSVYHERGGNFMALTAEFEVAVPPSPDEWHDMENTHLRGFELPM
jgi:hypothetical protein